MLGGARKIQQEVGVSGGEEFLTRETKVFRVKRLIEGRGVKYRRRMCFETVWSEQIGHEDSEGDAGGKSQEKVPKPVDVWGLG